MHASVKTFRFVSDDGDLQSVLTETGAFQNVFKD